MGRADINSQYSIENSKEIEISFVEPGHLDLAERLEALASELKNSQNSGVKSGVASASLAEVAKSLYSLRRRVDTLFGHEGFATSPGWDVMLDLYQAEAAHKMISVTSACIGAACPPTTALRWLQALESMGLIVRICDPADKRRTFVQQTPKGRAATEKALELYRTA